MGALALMLLVFFILFIAYCFEHKLFTYWWTSIIKGLKKYKQSVLILFKQILNKSFKYPHILVVLTKTTKDYQTITRLFIIPEDIIEEEMWEHLHLAHGYTLHTSNTGYHPHIEKSLHYVIRALNTVKEPINSTRVFSEHEYQLKRAYSPKQHKVAITQVFECGYLEK